MLCYYSPLNHFFVTAAEAEVVQEPHHIPSQCCSDKSAERKEEARRDIASRRGRRGYPWPTNQFQWVDSRVGQSRPECQNRNRLPLWYPWASQRPHTTSTWRVINRTFHFLILHFFGGFSFEKSPLCILEGNAWCPSSLLIFASIFLYLNYKPIISKYRLAFHCLKKSTHNILYEN